MEYIDKIFSAAKIIYSLCSEVKMNRKRCNRLKCRIEFLLEPVKAIKEEDLLDNLTNILKEMVEILESASDCVMSFTNKHWFSKAFKAFAIKEEFNHLNERLNDAAIALNLALNTEQTKILLTRFKKEDDMQDTEEDQKYLNLMEKELEKGNWKVNFNWLGLPFCFVNMRIRSKNMNVDSLQNDSHFLWEMNGVCIASKYINAKTLVLTP